MDTSITQCSIEGLVKISSKPKLYHYSLVVDKKQFTVTLASY